MRFNIDALRQLGVDFSFFYQIAIFLIVFILLDLLIFKKSLKVFTMRDALTKKKFEDIKLREEEYKKISKDYISRISAHRIKLHQTYNETVINFEAVERKEKTLLEKKYFDMYLSEKEEFEQETDRLLDIEHANINNYKNIVLEKLSNE